MCCALFENKLLHKVDLIWGNSSRGILKCFSSWNAIVRYARIFIRRKVLWLRKIWWSCRVGSINSKIKVVKRVFWFSSKTYKKNTLDPEVLWKKMPPHPTPLALAVNAITSGQQALQAASFENKQKKVKSEEWRN